MQIRLKSRQNKRPVRFFLRGLKLKDLQPNKTLPYIFLVFKEVLASLRMGIYEDRQIHTKTGFRPIKLQGSRSGPHTNQCNNLIHDVFSMKIPENLQTNFTMKST